MSHKNYYKQNSKYSHMLEGQDNAMFAKYVNVVERFSIPRNKVLDVGCGTGIFLSMASNRMHNRDFIGIDISETSISICKNKQLNCQEYNGSKIPFENEHFDIVGSVNVLEHVDDAEKYLQEQLRVLRSGGYLVLACPNFLSITNSYHHHTRGIFQKVKNIASLVFKLLTRKHSWKKMQTIQREDFQPDDDACNITNPVDILNWAKANDLKLVFWSSQIIYRKGILNILDRFSLARLFLGSSFMVYKKT